MAYNDDQNENPVPTNRNSQRKSSDLLPRYFRTSANKKFLGSTLDQFTNPGVVEKINAFVGSREAKAVTTNDNYLADINSKREAYQLSPAAVIKDNIDNITFYKDYNDYIGLLDSFSSNVHNHSALNSQEFYAWDPHIDFDKFVNFREYYWLPNGPQEVPIRGQGKNIVSTYKVKLVQDDDNFAFLFNDNPVRNPNIKLYRGQTYRFEIETPGHPFSLATNRAFSPGLGVEDSSVISTLYEEGVTLTLDDTDTLVNRADYIQDGYVEKGVLEFTVPENAPDTLYYISQYSLDTSGRFQIYNIEENSEINVEEEILGKKTYRTEEGWDLSNGMKVYFIGTVTPSKYATGLYYVDGVGSSITLTSINDLQVPAIFTQDSLVPFDVYGFDRVPYGDALSFAGSKDYVVMARTDGAKNAWARYNRWFHRDVIEKSAEINGIADFGLDESSRAKRPIIEYESGLRLYNHGTKTKQYVDLVDTFTDDVFSTIEGSLGYNVDGVDLVEGMRVLFTADPDSFVNGKIFEVKFILHNNVTQISLVETEDSAPELDQTILVQDGNNYAGRMFWYNGTEWKLAQDKTGLNQFPKFDLYDVNGVSLSDADVYPTSNFRGNRVFAYRVGEGANDAELGFPISYKNIENIGDIVFDFNLLSDTYSYEENNVIKNIDSDTCYLKKYNDAGVDFTYVNAWKKANRKSRQFVVRKYTGQERANKFPIDVYKNSGLLTDLEVRVYLNNSLQIEDTDYTFVIENNIKKIQFVNSISTTDIVVLKTFSNATKTDKGYYEVPSNLERNPLNQNIVEFTLGQVNDHVDGLVSEIPNFTGTQPGRNNLRDLGNVSQYGRKFVQHSGSIVGPLYHLATKESNIVKSIRFARNEYGKFKRSFIQIATDTGFNGKTKAFVDFVLQEFAKDKNKSMPFYNSDMLGIGGSKKLTYTVLDADNQYYAISNPFNLDTLSRKAINIYLNDEQLVYKKDYVFTNEGFVQVTATLAENDIIDIYEYETTEGTYIPVTPTKIGMYPAFEPTKFIDTSYAEPTEVIRGHDGSIIIAFGDYRDDLLLDLEKRIYNNLKVAYNPDIFDIYDYVEGENRNVNISKSDLNAIMITDFTKWLKTVGNEDYTDNSFVTQGVPFTYNYSKSSSPTGKPLPGFWRAVYKQAFDTDRPHTHPWEMLGFPSMPSWWTDVYGPAPYTRDNLILWQDLEQGAIKEPGQPVRRLKKFVRPGLTDHIPVDEYGRLLSPLQSNYVREFSYVTSKNVKFKFGDEAPTETAWRRSSEYPFSLLTAMLLMRPAQVFGIGFERSYITRDVAGNLVSTQTHKRQSISTATFPKTKTNGSINLTCGLINYVSSFMSNNITSSYESYVYDLQNIKTQLGFKLAGFADKSKLRLALDSRTPLNQGNVFVPDENYNIFLATSSTQEVVTYSGVIVEKTGSGYKIKGYDLENPRFTYLPHLVTDKDPVVNVGGISESFIEWSEDKIFVAGKVVRYEGNFYRVKTNHTSGSTFDATLYSRLSDLPLVGGNSAIFRKNFAKVPTTLDYGTVLSDYQQVVDFLLGYGKYLESLGFSFQYFNRANESLENWNMITKEFLFWTTQNWSAGTVIALSPGANNLTFERQYYVVDNVFDSLYDYSILKVNGGKLSDGNISVTRDNRNIFILEPKNTQDGIYFARLPLIQKEHAVIIDNTTVFNDVIYSPEPGYRQERIKVIGYRTDDWNGSLNIPGFIYDQAKVEEWTEWKDYSIGDLIKFKEFYYSAKYSHTGKSTFDYNDWTKLDRRPESSLKANWDYRSAQFNDFYDLDTDNFDSEQQRLAQHLIGYQKRQYLENIIQDDVSQYKFYQGMIQDKGTNNALTKLFDKLGSANKDSLEFNEEWAIRVGQYGATDSFEEVEYQLDESQFRIEPQTVELVSSVDVTRTDLVYQYPRKDVYLESSDYNHAPFPTTYSIEEYSKTGGYVKLDQINFFAKSENDIFAFDINKLDINKYVWIPQVQQSWDVRKHVLVPIQIIQIDKMSKGFVATFNKPVPFEIDDVVGLQGINDQIDGFYKVKQKTLNTCTFYTNIPIAEDSIDLSDSTVGLVSKLDSRRFATLDEVNQKLRVYDVKEKDRLWIDDNNTGKFEVFENSSVFSLQQEMPNPIVPAVDADYGSTIATNGNNTTLAVGMPGDNHSGAVYIYYRLSETSEYTLLQKITSNTLNTNDISFATTANPVRVTTVGNHGFTTYQRVEFSEISLGMTELSENVYYINVIDDQNFDLYTDIGLTTTVDGTAFTSWDVAVDATATAGDLYDVGANFGSSVALTDNGQYLFIGAPLATNVKTFYKGEFDPDATYVAGDIVSDRGTFWKAKITIVGDGSTINQFNQDWQAQNVVVNDITGYASGLENQGVVHIYKKQTNGSFVESSVIISPLSQSLEKFGSAIKVATKADETHRVFVKGETENGRLYFLNNQTQDADFFEYTRDRSYKGTFSSLTQYVADEVVFEDGKLYKALTNLLPGPFDVADWEELSTAIDYNGFIPSFSDVLTTDGDSTIADTLNIAGSFDVSTNGEVLIITNTLTTGENRVSVYRLENGRYTHSENIDSPVDNEAFGYTNSAISDDGRRIAVGSVLSDENGIDNGKVYVFKYDGTSFVLDQELFSPEGQKNELFGYDLDFSYNRLAVLSLNGDTKNYVTFDEQTTYFDNAATGFQDTVENTGQVYMFENVNEVLVYAEQMEYNRDVSSARNPIIRLSKNHLVVGLPGADYNDGTATGLVVDFRSNVNSTAWQSISVAVDFVDIKKLKGVFLYDKTTQDIVSYLDYIDPIQGKIAGPAEQALDYKLYYDPAVYTTGVTTTGNANPWVDEYVGKLWWDLSTVKWYNPYQGNTEYRANNWNLLLNTFEVDVYEWVGSFYKPGEWDQLSGTVTGESLGITGTTKYGDTTYATKQVYNEVTKKFENKYYYWVKNTVVLPEGVERNLSANEVADLIRDPAGQGYRFVAFYGNDRFGLYNVKNLIKNKDTILHVEYETIDDYSNNIHSEYQLLTEGLASSKPSADIVQKWEDSLVGYDKNANQLPDQNISVARRYGILNNPNQSMFVNKTEALKQVVERVNGILKNKLIVDDFDISPLMQKDPTPSAYSRTWDTSIASESLLRFVGVARIERAVLTPTIVDGKITEVTIVNPGRGYIDPIYSGTGDRLGPTVEITGTGSGAKIQTYINNLGQVTRAVVVKQGRDYKSNTTLTVRRFTVLVENDSTLGGFWALYTYNPTSQEWFRIDTQNYDTNLYWDYIDWYANGYDEDTNIDFLIDASYQLDGLDDYLGAIVKIQNIGTGGWLLLHKVDNQNNVDYTVNYETIGRQNGTIQFSELLYNSSTTGFDNQVYDAVLYDREPVQETRIILNTLQNNIFVDELEVEWNNLFFASVRYAMSEQVNLDWIFKTSFVRAIHNVGELEQSVTYKNNNLSNYQDYVHEVKPYSTKIREYISSYESVDPTQTVTTDFDLPPYYSSKDGKIITENIKMVDNTLQGLTINTIEYPRRHWFENIGFEIKDIVVYEAGSGYTEAPVVTISGGGGPTLTGYGRLIGTKVNFIDVNTNGAKYISAPTVTFNGSNEDGTNAKAVVILGSGQTRATHMTMKFDRTSGNVYITDLNPTANGYEEFTGDGGTNEFALIWPMNLNTTQITIDVDGVEQLSTDFVASNETDTTKSYTRYRGKITFVNAPASGSNIKVYYKKDVSMLSAAERISYFYNPTTGMIGNDLSQLMDGVEYSGVSVDSYGFGTESGFDTSKFASTPFDTYDSTFEDEIITLDASINVLELSQTLESGVIYNIYKNNVRIDDPQWDGSSAVDNPNALMPSIVGDGITNTIVLNDYDIAGNDGDVFVVRKSTSDGSFTPSSTVYDVALSGGSIPQGSTALGINAGEIVVDGDGFVTPTTSKGPEELVPGQLIDTLDMKVYNRVNDGTGIITTHTYVTDGETSRFNINALPQSQNDVIVKIGDYILDETQYTIDWTASRLEISDSSMLSPGQKVYIVLVGSSGENIIDRDRFVADGDTLRFSTSVPYTTEISAFVTINGVVNNNFSLKESDTGFVDIILTSKPGSGTFIDYTLFESRDRNYSLIEVDNSFIADGEQVHYTFPSLPIGKKPTANNILVRVDNTILTPGYNKKVTLTSARSYDIDRWQFADYSTLRKSDFVIFIDGEVLEEQLYYYDTLNGRITITTTSVGLPGQIMEMFIIRDAEYYFIDTVVKITDAASLDLELNNRYTITAGDSASAEVLVTKVEGDLVTFCGYVRTLEDVLRAGLEDAIVLDDSTTITIEEVNYVQTDVLTFATAPADGADVKIYTFSNHDVNQFERISLDVIVRASTSAPEGTDQYIDQKLLTDGVIRLRQPAVSSEYVWVVKDGVLLTAGVDYALNPDLQSISIAKRLRQGQNIQVIQFAAPISRPKFGFRIFKDMLNRNHFKRLNKDNEYKLAQNLNYYDLSIVLESADNLPEPNRNIDQPGIVWINGERIEYYIKDGTVLKQLRRGTLGTGIGLQYPVGSIVSGQGPEETIPYKEQTLTQVIIADGSTAAIEYTLDFDIWAAATNYKNNTGTSRNIEDIARDFIDVSLGGTLLRKTTTTHFDKSVALDSGDTNADYTVAPDFTVDANNNIFIQPRNVETGEIIPPSEYDGQQIKIVRRIGQVWNDSGKSLSDSTNQIARFIKDKTISLVR